MSIKQFLFDDRPLHIALEEDLHDRGDITSQATCPYGMRSTATIIAKEQGTIAGLPVAQRVFQIVEREAHFNPLRTDGERVKPGDIVATITGQSIHLLSAERVALNFLCRLSGIASLTARFVEAVSGTKVKILDTRKTSPGLRELEKYAVRVGGAENHRFGLYDMFLIKENHIAAAGGIKNAVVGCRNLMRTQGFHTKIEVEAQTLADVVAALEMKVDRIMLDNMTLEQMRQAVELVSGQIDLEASGNVNLETVRLIAEIGVDYISIGSLTHSAPALDFSMLLEA